MEQELLEAVNEMQGEDFKSLDEAGKLYTNREIMDSWLRYEGISGYTNKIIAAFDTMKNII